MTDALRRGHPGTGAMTAALDLAYLEPSRAPRAPQGPPPASPGGPASERRAPTRSDVAPAPLTFERVYDRWFDFVWRSIRRLGVADAQVDDAVQDVFVVVHRRLDGFEGRSTLKTWLFGIAMRVAKDYRRAASRRRPTEPLRESLVDGPGECPMESCAKAEAVELLHALLNELEDDKRAVFVMAELEQMSVPEIAGAIEENVNTVYSRLRAGRQGFEAAVARHLARERWRGDR